MLPTPDTSHVDTALIYEPAEDSFLLIDTLAAESSFLGARFPPDAPAPLIAELGTGSGVVLAFAAAQAGHVFGRPVMGLGIDANEHACRATLATARKAAPGWALLGCIQADLASALRPGSVDVLLFNPPYVPTPPLPEPARNWARADEVARERTFESESRLLELAYAGGDDGMQVTDRFLAHLPATLAGRGVGYLLLCQQNRPADVVARIQSWEGGGVWAADVVRRSGGQGGWEKLCVLRIYRRRG